MCHMCQMYPVQGLFGWDASKLYFSFSGPKYCLDQLSQLSQSRVIPRSLIGGISSSQDHVQTKPGA